MSSRQPVATPTLICKECSFENEAERVYCHSCGAKLDRSILPPDVAARREDPAEVQRRLQRMTNPNRGKGLGFARRLLTCVLTAAVLAALVLIFLPPRDVPQLAPGDLDNARMINSELEDFLAGPGNVRRTTYPEAAVNAYLQSTLRPKKVNAANVPGLDYRNAYVHFFDGNRLQLTQQQSLLGYVPLSATAFYTLGAPGRDGKPAPVSAGGRLGRLPVHPALMRYADRFLFSPIFTAARGDLRLLERLGAVSCRNGAVELNTRPGVGAGG